APDYSPAYAELGLIYQLKGDHQKALSAFETYLQRPALESPEAYDRNEIRSQAERERRLVNQPTMRRKP
ncbi:MAG TPA: hypothetical protein VFV34_07790, partial [Blastocatellia bacterium]|nr:hypothetical protein [Blastocatellia bacterium]